jgi:hypothetical protein
LLCCLRHFGTPLDFKDPIIVDLGYLKPVELPPDLADELAGLDIDV